MAVYFFYGQEEFLMEKEIKKLKDELLDVSFLSMAYKVFDNPDFSTLLECLQSAPLMFGNSLNIVYLEDYLLSSEMSFTDKEIESIEFALKSINNAVNVVFICKVKRDSTRKVDSRKKLFKILSMYSQVREFAQFRSYDKTLPPEIIKIAKEKELTISSSNVALLVERLGVNLTLISSELDKLKTIIHPKTTIDENVINKYCTSTEDIFSLADLIVQGNKNAVLKQYSILTEKKHPLEILGVLQHSFQQFIHIKSYEKSMSPKEIAAKIKLHEFIVMKTQEKLKKISLEKLLQIRKLLLNAELKNKSSDSYIGEVILEIAMLG